MYYSKNSSTPLNVPRNYSGNTFRVIDETERHYIKEQPDTTKEKSDEISTKIESKTDEKAHQNSLFSSFLSDISIEDILLLGLMLVIHQENPNDSMLLFLLILLLAK